MTGISVTSPTSSQPPRNHQNKDLTPAQRYSELKLAPERYSIIQLGIALYFYHDDTEPPHHHYSVTGTTTRSDVTQLPASPLRSSGSTSGRGYSDAATTPIPGSPKVVSMYDVKTHIPPGTKYSVRRYNFYMFPDASTSSTIQQLPRDIVMNVSTIAFLLEHNMSFDLWTRYGIPYATSRSQAQAYIKAYLEQESRLRKEELGKALQQQRSPVTIQEVVRNRVVLRRVDDIAFHARTMATLRDWLDSPITHTSSSSSHAATETPSTASSSSCTDYDTVDPYLEQSLLLPPCNSFLRRALYESINTEYPTLVLERNNNNGGNGGQQQIRVFRLNAEENDRRKHYLQQQRFYHFIMNQIGIYRIFAALRLVCNGHTIDYNHILFAKSYNDIDWDAIWNTAECDSPYDFTRVSDVNDVAGIIGLELEQDPHSVLAQYPRQRTPIPLVVHNGFMDLCFLMTHFVSHPLPKEYQECKGMIRTIFPYIYDTKILATECPCFDENDQHSVNSNLSTLFQMIARNPNYYYNHHENPEQDDGDNVRTLLDDIYVIPAFTPKMSSAKSKNTNRSVMVTVDDQEHEAAYDAYMTGAIFIGLCQRIHSRLPSSSSSRQSHFNTAAIGQMVSNIHGNVNKYKAQRLYYGLNKLYQMSIYTMDLEETRKNRDPMSRGLVAKYTYRISNIDPAITTRDIVAALSNLHDTKNRPVNFLIIWIDDVTFLVAASYSQPIIQSAPTVQPQPVVVVNDEPEEGEEVDETTETAVAVDSMAETTNTEINNTIDDFDSILREHADFLLNALRERFQNSATTIVVLQDYLEAQSVAGSDNDAANDDGFVQKQDNSWMNRMWLMMGWPFNSSTVTTMNKRHAADDNMDASSTKKRQRIQ